MKIFLTAVWALICAAVLFWGHSYWNDRIAAQGTKSSVQAAESVSIGTDAGQTGAAGQSNLSSIMAKAKNWPAAAQTQLEQSIKENKSFKVLFVGSSAIGTAEKGVAKDVADGLVQAYGTKIIQPSIQPYNMTSMNFVQQNDQAKMAAEKAQMIIFEPFILNNNGQVSIWDTLANIQTIMKDVQSANPQTVFILQPSFPLYGAKYYPIQVSELKSFAQTNHLAYLNHWTAWPDTNDSKLKDYLLPDQSGPSDKGIQVWSQYLLHYLVSE